MAEFALVVPLLLILIAVAVDLGRLFFAYVAVENAAKEGALYGARNPLCADATNVNCSATGKSVQWYVENEAAAALKNANGTSRLTTGVTCRAPNGTIRQPINDCVNGDTYEVRVTYGFQLLTPILNQFIGPTISLVSQSESPVIGDAFDPSGLEVLIWVDSSLASNQAAIATACQPADAINAAGYFYGPCQDQNNVDNYLSFNEGQNVSYKVRVRNTGNIALTSVSYQFTVNGVNIATPSTCNNLPGSLAKNAAAVFCTFMHTTVASDVTLSPVSDNLGITASASASGLASTTNGLAVVNVVPIPRLEVNVWASRYRLGDDGDGLSGVISYPVGALTIVRDATSTDTTVQTPVVWLYLRVRNQGAQANSFSISLTRDAVAVATATCNTPTSLGVVGTGGSTFTCVLPVTFPTTVNSTFALSASATNATMVTGTQTSVSVAITGTCTAGQKVVPNLVDHLTPTPDGTSQTVGEARGHWQPTFTGTFATAPGGGADTKTVTTQNRTAYACLATTTSVTVGAP